MIHFPKGSRTKGRARGDVNIVAAKGVFSKKGFSRTIMEDITNEAQFGPGTPYLYFKNTYARYASLLLRILKFVLIRLEHLSSETQFQVPCKRKDILKTPSGQIVQRVLGGIFNNVDEGDVTFLASPNIVAEIRNMVRC